MLFNSLAFLLFFPLAVGGFFFLPQRVRWLWLLVVSCWFYMAFVPIYILILFFTIAIDYPAGLLIERAHGRSRQWLLVLSIVANCGVLGVFKYYDFITGNIANLFKMIDWTWSVPRLGLILPIGLSFHTFQAMSYTIEVYRGRHKAERHLGIYALYVMFFPQLVAGPIERPQNLLPQFREHHTFDYVRVTDGLKRMTWGMFKKVCIADRLALYVNQVYDVPHANAGYTLLLATIFFAFQIYCDFSGYSDIAIGAAEVMGFRLRENFRRPYFSQSIAEFWTRWHISLSTWFRDYLYIPLGGSREGKWTWARNVMIVFLVSGLWHGASWTFVVWGALNGLYILAGHAIGSRFAIPKWIRMAFTFVLTCFAWIFFRAKSMDDALFIATHLFGGVSQAMASLVLYGRSTALAALLLVAVLLAVHLLQERMPIRPLIARQPRWLRWSVYYCAVLAIVVFGEFDGPQAFIYFQF